MANLQELRQQTLEWLDNPDGDEFAPNGIYRRLDLLINYAQEQVYQIMEGTSAEWNVEAVPITVNVVATTREYSLGTGIRKIIDIVRKDADFRTPLRWVQYTKRNTYGGSGSGRYPFYGQGLASIRYGGGEVYVFRDGAGKWTLGFVYTGPQAQTVEVNYIKELADLASPGDKPSAIPAQWHRLIGLKAALLGKAQTNRDPGWLTQEWLLGVRAMKIDLERIQSPMKSRTF